jgi:drug/metabolite transporter (DMT)-like permease
MQTRELGGAALVVATALSFAASVTMARIVYDDGGTAITVLSVRFISASSAFYLWFRLRGEQPWLPWRLALPAFGIGLIAASYVYGYLGAVQFIPMSLAVLIFYLNPLLVGLMAFLLERRSFGKRKAIALLLGLLGVSLALDVSFTSLDWRGLALAFMGAHGVALTAILSQRLLRKVGSLTLAFHVSLISAPVFVGVGLLGGGLALPRTAGGLWALAGMPIAATCGTIGFYLSLRLIGAVKTSTIMNAEPVFTVLAAVLILREPFGPLQILGACLVGAAIFLVSRGPRLATPDPAQ